jgi:hypothetical protein
LSLAVVRDLRDVRSPAGPDELAAFETDVLAGFVLARAAAGLADVTIRSDVSHPEQVRAWFGRPLWDMEPADADAYFGKVLRGAAKGTRLGRSQALRTLHPRYPRPRPLPARRGRRDRRLGRGSGGRARVSGRPAGRLKGRLVPAPAGAGTQDPQARRVWQAPQAGDSPVAGTAIRRCLLRHCSLLPFAIPLPPFPMCRALSGSEYYGGSAPPGPFSGRCAYPGQRAGCPPPGTITGWFPRSLPFAQRRRSPAVSQRHRHRYAADLPHGLPGLLKESSREVPAAQRSGRTHCTRPISTRFEPVYEMKDLMTPVPRVLLSATLAGPAPSGSADTSRLLSGLLPPSPAPPGSGCPQLHRPAATGRRRRSLTSTRTTALKP